MSEVSCYRSASDVRRNWSMTIDSVVRERPAFINRTHDYITMLDTRLLMELLKDYKYHVTIDREDDGSITGFVEELDLVENGKDENECIKSIILAMKDYAEDYYAEFSYWSKASNRTAHIPYVLKLLISSEEDIVEDIVCQDGRN